MAVSAPPLEEPGIGDGIFSPELVLVSPELRARAIAALPVVRVDDFVPAPYREPPGSEATPGWYELPLVIWDFTRVGLVSFGVALIIVLSLTLAADAIR